MIYDLRFKGGHSIFFIFLTFILNSLFLNLKSAQAATNPISYPITISATIGEPKLTLYGYSSPKSLVRLEGNRVSEHTVANQQGFFLFDRVFLPIPKPDYPELCLGAIDSQSRISFPTCLPPLPVGPYEITVGPVLLPPTISLSKGKYLPHEQVAATGATIPNTEVTIFLANDMAKVGLASLIPVANAYSLPLYQVKSNKNGHFELNLPAGNPSIWKIFAGSTFFDSPTPKSNTLTFRVLSWWEWFLEQIKLKFNLLKPNLWGVIIWGEILIIIGLLIERQTRQKPKGLAIRQADLLVRQKNLSTVKS